MINFFRYFAIISFGLILFQGWMSAFPLILWLVFTIFDFGNIDQIFAIFAVAGIIMNFTKLKNSIPISLISFVLMLSPLISRMSQVPLSAFNYSEFKIPLLIFFLSYIAMILFMIKKQIFSTEIKN